MTIAWKIDVNISDVRCRRWVFLPFGKALADIVLDLDISRIPQNSPGPFTIKKPSTLILKNVNIQYNGTHRFSIIDAYGKTTLSDVTVFVAGKWLLFNILPFDPTFHQTILHKF